MSEPDTSDELQAKIDVAEASGDTGADIPWHARSRPPSGSLNTLSREFRTGGQSCKARPPSWPVARAVGHELNERGRVVGGYLRLRHHTGNLFGVVGPAARVNVAGGYQHFRYYPQGAPLALA